MKTTSNKKNNIRNKKHSRKNLKKNKLSRKNVGKYSRKNVMKGGNILDTYIKQLKQNDSTLTELHISNNNIGFEGAIAIAKALETNTTLTTLFIDNNNIGVEGSKAIAEALKTNTTLTELHISNNNIGFEGAIAIAKALETNTTLTTLFIDNNNIGVEGAKAIEEALKTNKDSALTIIDFNYNNIIDSKIKIEIENSLAEVLKRNQYQIKYVPELKILKNTNNNSRHIENVIEFIDTILKSEDIIKNKTLNNTGKEEFYLKYKKILSGSKDISNFKKLISNNYTNGNKALKEIDKSNKYIINLHGGLSNNIFKLPDNINIIFLTPNSYLTVSKCALVSVITLENIKQYIENPYCTNNNPYFKEAILYLGGQYCIDINLFRSDNDSVASGIHYVSESEIETPYLFKYGKYSFTLSIFLEIGKDHTQKMFEKDSQYTFIVTACREVNSNPNQYEYNLMNKLVLYEITIKILNFYLHFINKDKRAKMNSENNNNETIENKYSKCKIKKHKEIYLGSNKRLMFLQYFRHMNTKEQKGLVRSRTTDQIVNDTVVKQNNSSISVSELKQIVNEIDDINKQEKFNLLSERMNIYRQKIAGNNKPKSEYKKSIFLHEKQTFDIIKYIFQDKYDLMFEFIVYIDLKFNIINFGYFKDLKDLKKKIDVSKITYRINLSTLQFIVSNLTKEDMTTLNIIWNNYGDNEIEEIIKTLKDNTTITKLYISKDNIFVEDAKELAKALAKALAEALKSNTTLTNLNISYNYFGISGAIALAEALKSNTTLTKLNISENKIGDSGAIAIATALKSNTTLTTLDISWNNIGDAGATALANMLKVNISLTNLNISYNQIGDEGATAIAAALKYNTTLTNLNINYNQIGDKGAKAIAKGLEKNTTLTTVNISENKIGVEGAQAIEKALKVNRTLTIHNISNNISEDMQT